MDEKMKMRELVLELTDTIGEVLIESERVTEKVAKIRAAGYDPILFIEGIIALEKMERPTTSGEITPLVKGEEVVEGTFSDTDIEMLNALQIKLNADPE